MTRTTPPGSEALLLALLLAAGEASAEGGKGPAIERLEDIRAAVARLAEAQRKEPAAHLEALLAQFPNFPNFANFPNFPNFQNWPNFRNYR